METKANNYAAAASENLLKDALKAAYIQGYKDGQKDNTPAKAEPIIVNGIEYVDLGLPSGTLWAKDYATKGGKTIYLTTEEAKDYNIPTQKQFEELVGNCIIRYNKVNALDGSLKIIGRNGVCFTLRSKGYFAGNETDSPTVFYFPFKESIVSGNKTEVKYCYDNRLFVDTNLFVGFKFPILTVK